MGQFLLVISLFFAGVLALVPHANGGPVYGSEESSPDILSTLAIVRQSRALSQLLLKREIIGLELIQVSGVTELNKPESWFGHSALRFVGKDSSPLGDLVMSFEMVNLNSAKTYQKGLRGGWASYATVIDLATYISRYSIGQSRSIKRMPIPTTPEIIQQMKLNILAIQELPDLVGDYNFLSNNCATGLLRLLGMSGVSTPQVVLELPQQLDQLLRKSLVAYLKPSQIPQFQEVVNQLAISYLRKNARESQTPIELLADPGFQDHLLTSQNERQMAFLIYFWPNELNSLKAFRWRLADQFREALEKIPVSSFIASYPVEFYTVCERKNKSCHEARLEQLKKSDSVDWKQLRHASLRHQQELARSEQLIISAKKEMQSYLKSPVVLDIVELSKELRK